jgi:tripartite-type tricarboxylate transporter receptor subunit TctC
VAFAPGGIADTIARGVGQKMSERLGQPVVVETKSGAGGMVGGEVRRRRGAGRLHRASSPRRALGHQCERSRKA